MTCEKIDYQKIENDIDLRLTNSKYRYKLNRGFHERTILILRNAYVKKRGFLSKLWKEDEMDKCILNTADRASNFRREHSNAASKQIDLFTRKEVDPVFSPEYIQFSEPIPKEYVSLFDKRIVKFINKYEDRRSAFNRHQDVDFEYYSQINKAEFMHRVADFNINQDTDLGVIFSACTIQIESISESFVNLIFQFSFNDTRKKRINDLCVNNMSDVFSYSDLSQVKLRNCRKIQKGFFSGSEYKKYALSVFFNEVKYRTRRILYSYFRILSFPLNQNEASAFVYFETNIDGNSDKFFWESIGLIPHHLYFSEGHDSCIVPGSKYSGDIMCIFRRNPHYEDYGIYKYSVCDCFNRIIAFSNIEEAGNEGRTIVNRWMYESRSFNIDIWLELKKRAEDELRYIERFAKNIKCFSWNYYNFYSMSGAGLFQSEYYEIEKQRFGELEKEINNILEIVDSNVERKNTSASLGIQQTSFVIDCISALLALTAIIISLISNETMTVLINFMAEKQWVLKFIAFIFAIIFAGTFIKVINKSYDFCFKKSHFKIKK